MNFYKFLVFIIILNFYPLIVHAQLCQGNLSEPIIQIDFGQAGIGGPDYGPALPSGQTTYAYNGSSAIVDGQYTITKNANIGRPEWHTTSDHTPNDNEGYMLLVNADVTPGEFYRARVTGLCESTLFEFSAWVMNVVPPPICSGNALDPNVRFEIRDTAGNLLGTTNTGPITESTSPQWNKYGVSITTGPGMNEVDVIMLNNGPGGCGNDLAIDDIEFKACGDLATVVPSIPDAGICSGGASSATIDVQLDGSVYASPVFQWQISTNSGTNWSDIAGQTNNTLLIDPLINGMRYRYKVAETPTNLTSSNCSVISEDFEVIIHDLPSIMVDIPDPLCEGSDVNLTATSNKTIGNTTWTLPDGSTVINNSLSFTPIDIANSGSYSVIVEDTNGCMNSLPFQVNVQDTSVVNIYADVCVGDMYPLPDGSTTAITQDETFTHFLKKVNNCDSTVISNITANPVYDYDEDVVICRGSQITLPNGSFTNIQDDMSLDYFYKTNKLCDSIVTRNYIVPDTTFINDRICLGDRYSFPDGNKTEVFVPQFITYNLPATGHHCDSVVVLDLSVDPVYNTSVAIKECPVMPVTLPKGEVVTQSGTYFEYYKSAANCDSTVVYTVDMSLDSCSREEICTIRLPQAFTPNGNNKNDEFGPLVPLICPYDSYSLKIFNRWGGKVFESTNVLEKWNGGEGGAPGNSGIYLYYLDYAIIMEDGSLLPKKESGKVVLLR